jgi:hypothetical protein
LHRFDEIDGLIQFRINDSAIIPHKRHTNLGPLMAVIGSNFGHRSIEVILKAIDNSLDDLSLSLQRVIAVKPKNNCTNAYNHVAPVLRVAEKNGVQNPTTNVIFWLSVLPLTDRFRIVVLCLRNYASAVSPIETVMHSREGSRRHSRTGAISSTL